MTRVTQASRRSLAEEPPVVMPRGCSHFKLRQTERLVSRFYNHQVAGAGVTTPQYSLLSHLATLGPMRPADLAARMGLTPSTLSRNLQPLAAQGWLEVGPGADERSRLISLTPAGRVKRTQAQREWKKAQLAFNARLGVAKVAQLHALLDECQALLADGAEHPEEEDTR